MGRKVGGIPAWDVGQRWDWTLDKAIEKNLAVLEAEDGSQSSQRERMPVKSLTLILTGQVFAVEKGGIG